MAIEELIRCSICLEIISKPYECEACGHLFYEFCINQWLKVAPICPMRCKNLKLIKARLNTRKILNLIKLKCINYPECKVVLEYWDCLIMKKNVLFKKLNALIVNFQEVLKN